MFGYNVIMIENLNVNKLFTQPENSVYLLFFTPMFDNNFTMIENVNGYINNNN